MGRVRVATLNIRSFMDRWDERLPLLLADMAALQPDLLGLQEVLFVMQMDRLIGAAGAGRYEAWRGPSGRPEYGNSILVRAPLDGSDDGRLDLGLGREAHAVLVGLSDGGRVRFATTHLHHPPDAAAERDDQATSLVGWLDGLPPADATILTGDFNADPTEPAYARLSAAGFRSAHLETNGSEPAVTWPSGLEAPAKDTDGEPSCLDYIWLRGGVRAIDCTLAWDRPAVGDPTLYPSDHVGLIATVEVGGA